MLQNLTIKIVDNAGVQMSMEMDAQKSEIVLDFGQVLTTIKHIFKEEYSVVSSFFKISEPIEFVVNLEQRKGDTTHHVLACFNAETSSNNQYRFNIFYDALLLFAKYSIEKNDSLLDQFRNTILHELMHAADLPVLQETIELNTKSYSLQKNQYSPIQILSDETETDYSVQWAFLNFISTFRNEGVAILGEKLLSRTNEPLCQRTLALASFKADFEQALNLCKGMQFYQSLESNRVNSVLQELKRNAYQYADIIMLEVLFSSGILSEEEVKCIYEFMKSDKSGIDRANHPYKHILESSINLDLSEYMQGLLRIKTDDEFLFNSEMFYNYCGILQKEEMNEGANNFAKLLSITAFNGSRDLFIKQLQSIIGSPMELGELEKLFSEFENKDYKEDIAIEIKKLGRRLLNEVKQKKNQVAIWAMTYLLDEEDLIHDKIDVLGLQDDWFVLDAAVKLI